MPHSRCNKMRGLRRTRQRMEDIRVFSTLGNNDHLWAEFGELRHRWLLLLAPSPKWGRGPEKRLFDRSERTIHCSLTEAFFTPEVSPQNDVKWAALQAGHEKNSGYPEETCLRHLVHSGSTHGTPQRTPTRFCFSATSFITSTGKANHGARETEQ